MVKITNPLGDVKIGKQGEVVYQRKYGEQIRRTASPKRAMPSQAQIAHRQLYKDALSWRSNLSLPNRRYLDGYCIANHITDSYHIPLPWSRFALKVYLEAVKFVPIEPVGIYIPSVNEKQQGFYTETHSQVYCGANEFDAETFLTSYGYPITSVWLRLKTQGSPYVVNVSIRDADPDNKPTGGDLTTGSFNGNTLEGGGVWNWKQIELTPYQLLPNHRYATLVNAPNAAIPARLLVGVVTVGYLNPDGRRCHSMDSGVTWIPYDTHDEVFETWGDSPPGENESAILHIRHPALLSVIHKRGGLSINGYDTLSSLDEEYITSQVGVDVFKEDELEVTTITGRSFTYRC